MYLVTDYFRSSQVLDGTVIEISEMSVNLRLPYGQRSMFTQLKAWIEKTQPPPNKRTFPSKLPLKWSEPSPSWSPPSWFILWILDTECSMWASLQCISVDASYILSVLFLWGTDTGAHQGLLLGKFCSHFNKRLSAYQAPWAWGTLFARPMFPAAGQFRTFASLSGLHHALQETWLWNSRKFM